MACILLDWNKIPKESRQGLLMVKTQSQKSSMLFTKVFEEY